MFVADPSGPALATILWTMLGGYLAAGGAGAINHYLERDRDARMARTCGRPLVAGRIEPRHGLVVRDRARRSLAIAELALAVNALAAALALAGLLGYVFVYTLWLKPLHAAEHRHRRRRRRRAAAGRLGGGDRRADPRRALSVRDRLPLDAAPLLGAGPAGQGRLRAQPASRCSRSPAARRRRAARSSPTAWRWWRSRCCRTSPACSERSTWRRRSALGAGFVGLAAAPRPAPLAGGRGSPPPRLARLPGAAVLCDGGRPGDLRLTGAPLHSTRPTCARSDRLQGLTVVSGLRASDAVEPARRESSWA